MRRLDMRARLLFARFLFNRRDLRPACLHALRAKETARLTIILRRVSGGREGLPGRIGVEVRGSLQDALRRRPGAVGGAASSRNERHRPMAQHSAHHQSFTAHLRAREIFGGSLIFASSSAVLFPNPIRSFSLFITASANGTA